MKKKIVGIIGSGLIGRNPYHDRAWSGSSKYFFEACRKRDLLARAFGIEVPIYFRYPLLLSNFSTDRERWRQKFYFDIRYYKKLTLEIKKKLSQEDFRHNFLQIGGVYNVPSIVDYKSKCYSYHDGNIAQLLKSPYMVKGISDKKIAEAFEYERNVYRGMNKIFTMSNYLKRSFIDDFGIDENKVVCIGAGINIDKFPVIVNKSYNNKEILFVGIRFYRKGGETLLKAFRLVRERFPAAKLHIIGPQKLYIPPELDRGVVFHGFLSRREPNQRQLFDEILFRSSLFVMPSLYEPFGIAPLEAMVNGIPCILTNKWAFPEMVEPGVNGELVECEDELGLANKIIKLLGNTDMLSLMGMYGRKMVLKNFTWEKVVERLSGEITEFEEL